MKKEVAEKEHKLSITTQQYVELQRQLESMIYTIARETEDIKRLEQELRDGEKELLLCFGRLIMPRCVICLSHGIPK